MSQNMTHTITLKAVDGTSVVFQRIGQSATAAATQIQAAGQKAAQGLNAEALAADKAAASTTKFGASAGGAARGISAIGAAARGAGFATFLGFLSNAANAAAEDEAAFVRLETAVDATGVSYNESAQSIERHIVAAQRLAFSDDAAADAIATMTAQTQSATTAQENLGLAMDFARGKHISLQTAATVVGKVASGNTAILTRYGIVLDENATSTEALAALQERFNGQAEAFSTTQAGAIARVQENLDNMAESLGGALGPMQTWLALLPGITSGMQLAGAAAGVLAGGEAAAGAAGAAGAVGVSAFAAAIAPLLIGGVAVAGIALLAKHIIDTRDASQTAITPIAELTGQIRELGNAAEFANTQRAIGEVATAWDAAAVKIQAANDALAEAIEKKQQISQGTTGTGGALGISAQDAEAAQKRLDLAQQEIDMNAKMALSDSQVAVAKQRLAAIEQSTLPDRARLINEAAEAIDQFVADGDGEKMARTLNSLELEARGAAAGIEDFGAATVEVAGNTNFVDFLDTMYQHLNDVQMKADETRQHLLNVSAGGQFNDPSIALGIGGSRGPGQIAQESADLEAASQARLAERIEETAQARADAISKAYEHAQAMDDEAAAAVSTADALIGTTEDRAQSVLRAAEAEEQYAERVSDINSNLSETLGNLQEGYADQTADIAQRRVDIEEQAAERMQSLNEARIDAAKQAEEQLADVAEQRADIAANAAEQAQRAEQAWMQTAAQNLQAQADVRERLQETTADAAQKWHDLNAQNLEQQRAIRVELQTTIADIQRELHASQQEAQRDLQRLAQDHRTAMADFRLDASRIREDLALVLNDPRATAEQKNAAELAAQRQLQDLKRQERDEEESHDRAKEDIRRGEREAIADAARQEADAREQARTDYRQLAEERAAAEQAYHEQVSQANEQAATQLQNLADQRAQALAQYQQQQADAHQQTADQLADLQSREQEILEQRAEKYADIEAQRQKLQQDTADQQEALAKQAADAEQQFNESVADAQQAAAEQRIDAQKQYAEATKSDMTELQRLREEGLITEGEYRKIYTELIEVQETSKSIEDLKLISALKQIDAQQELLDIEKAKAKAAAEGRKEPDDPLDGPPPRRLLGGMARLGTLVGEAGSELAIKGSRMWEVGRRGPEVLNLASGTLIMPHGAAQARMRGMALGGHATDSAPQVTTSPASRRGQGSTINNYGTITIKVDNADVGSEIARQLAGQRR